MTEIKGYITNLGKYNEGELVGKWIEFPIDEDDLNEVFYEIGMNYTDGDGQYIDRGYEEYFFTDWECEFSHDFGEYESILKINEIAEKLEDWDIDKFNAVCEMWSVTDALENNEEDYILYDDIYSDYDLGYYYVEESGIYNLEELGALRYYIDYESFGRDVRFESNGGHTTYGYIEYIG